jgi:hypothetical protein
MKEETWGFSNRAERADLLSEKGFGSSCPDAFPNSAEKETRPWASTDFFEVSWLDMPSSKFLPTDTSPPAMIGSMQGL